LEKELALELGILVNTSKNLKHVIGLIGAALKKGHSARLFVMDEGTRLLENSKFTGLSDHEKVKMSFCEYNTGQLGINLENLNTKIKKGTQLNNAIMCEKSDKILVL
jgi:hypothetical protein